MTKKVYTNFYDCMNDLGVILGLSSLDDLDRFGVQFAIDSGFPDVAKYFKENANRLRYHIRREFEEDFRKTI